MQTYIKGVLDEGGKRLSWEVHYTAKNPIFSCSIILNAGTYKGMQTISVFLQLRYVHLNPQDFANISK